MFNSIASTLPIAAATGRLTVRPNSIVRHIITDTKTGRAAGVAFVDRVTHVEGEAFAKVIIVAASTLESTRILFNSKSRHHPQGMNTTRAPAERNVSGRGTQGYRDKPIFRIALVRKLLDPTNKNLQ